MNYVNTAFILLFTFSSVIAGEVIPQNSHAAFAMQKSERERVINELLPGAGMVQEVSNPEAVELAGYALAAYFATKRHPLYLELCQDKKALNESLERLKKSTSDLLPLGERYFAKGIFIKSPTMGMQQTAQELNGGLSYFLLGTTADFRQMSSARANERCSEFVDEMNAMAEEFSD